MVQLKVNQILESSTIHFDNLEQALEERATIFQLSELSETIESLVKWVSALEKENSKLRELVCRCDDKGSKENPIEVEDSNTGLSYDSTEGEEVLPTVLPQVLPTVSGQRCRPHIPFASRALYPSLSPDNGATRSLSRICKARMVFSQAVYGLERTREQ